MDVIIGYALQIDGDRDKLQIERQRHHLQIRALRLVAANGVYQVSVGKHVRKVYGEETRVKSFFPFSAPIFVNFLGGVCFKVKNDISGNT
ncbi:hypothetical protein MTR_7g080420 [Medicago truncatula]|uniref:Uncharacterized protein n=1 Tax=Medicago truncatula TaxID=3880 RepID=G7KSD7_MEDTR|nr:hypothetical protein MTR_7g080420 [Medicago truncatula]